jgi:NADH:ubiquinone oxidoreductase subunit 6 (subunit J)
MAGSEILLNAVFYGVALLTIGGAILVATSRNIVRSAFSLLAVLFGAAALYALMKADFIAAAQVLIYVGGILVLIIFAIMLTHRITDVKVSNDSTPGPAAFCACLCLLFALVVTILFTAKWKRGSEEIAVSSGEVRMTLLQYQADGDTGLARGGNAFEDSVVVAVKAPQAPKGGRLEIVATHEKGAQVTETAPVSEAGMTRILLKGLAEGKWQWQARLTGPDLKPMDRVGDGDGKPDFQVYRGITEPAALALAGPYLFAFEVVSVLLLAALVGAAFLARKEVKE